MRRFLGHLRARRPLAEVALFLLLDEYDGYEPFVDDCLRVKEERAAALSRSDPVDRLVRARELVAGLASRWNLNRVPQMRENGYWQLTQALERVGEQIGRIRCGPFRPLSATTFKFVPDQPTVAHGGRTWEWSLIGHESLGMLRKRIMGDLDLVSPDQLPAEVRERLWDLPGKAENMGFELGDLPHGVKKHVRWLFLRLCPQPEHPLGCTLIARREDREWTDVGMIRRRVAALAREMRIDLPSIPPGRPRTRAQ